VIHAGGISAIRISNSSGGIEVDHLQYGIFGAAPPPPPPAAAAIPVPTMSELALLLLALLAAALGWQALSSRRGGRD